MLAKTNLVRRERMVEVETINANRETVTVTCPQCHRECVFNRVEDIGQEGPIAGLTVKCFFCHEELWIGGDLAAPGYQLLIFEARIRFNSKNYGDCILSLARAWEVFFATFLYENCIDKPFCATRLSAEMDHFNQLRASLKAGISNLSFFDLVKLVINFLKDSPYPTDLETAGTAVGEIEYMSKLIKKKKGLPEKPLPQDEGTREIISDLNLLVVNKLRNKIVHHEAYRPNLSEATKCLKELQLLYRIKKQFGVGDFSQYILGLV
jgi:hypothetical protein